MNINGLITLLLLMSSGAYAVASVFEVKTTAPVSLRYEIIRTYPHDTRAFTQGLVWQQGALYEGTGRYGVSRIAKLDLVSGKVLQARRNAPTEFGEGITILKGKLYQLTWQERKIHVYDAKSFKPLAEHYWAQEGWGITHNGRQLIISTGSDQLYFLNPATMQVQRRVSVTLNQQPQAQLNELEYVNGYIYANQFLTQRILQIHPQTGQVTGVLDLSDLLRRSQKTLSQGHDPDAVLNGIAYRPDKKTFYITGKLWDYLFELKIHPASR